MVLMFTLPSPRPPGLTSSNTSRLRCATGKPARYLADFKHSQEGKVPCDDIPKKGPFFVIVAHRHTQTRTHTPTMAHTHTCTHAHSTHPYTHTHTHTHTRTHTHTHGHISALTVSYKKKSLGNLFVSVLGSETAGFEGLWSPYGDKRSDAVQGRLTTFLEQWGSSLVLQHNFLSITQ